MRESLAALDAQVGFRVLLMAVGDKVSEQRKRRRAIVTFVALGSQLM